MGLFSRAVQPSNDRNAAKNAKTSRAKKDKEYEEAKARQKSQAKLKHVGKPRSTEWMNAEIPEGYKSVKTADGRYVIVKK